MTGEPELTSAAARATIARLEAELERLRLRAEAEPFAERLAGALSRASATGTIASPVSHARLLELIVETAADVISARAGALFLLDEEAQELVFEVALGGKAEEVKKHRVPLGSGIAGLVALSGQPLAVSDASSDPRQARDLAEAVGYTPESILCVPLVYGEETIGVLELLDKEGAPSFGAADLEALGLCARQAAVALRQSRTHESMAALVAEVMESVGEPTGESGTALAALAEADPASRRARELARLVHEIAAHGEDEAEACAAILRAFAGYLDSRPGFER
ncbi:MAG: GAF domain-containing protein [Thermoleophilia bacterium]|nr:GAF domain-containing protein [Thermoleophilia bacterium]